MCENIDMEFINDLKRKGLINHPDSKGRSPLYIACMCGKDLDIIETLLDAGAQVDLANRDNETPLYITVSTGYSDISVVETLLEAGANPNIKSSEFGYSSLRRACEGLDIDPKRSNEKIIEILLEAGADPNTKDNLSWTPLYSICDEEQHDSDDEEQHERIVRILLKHGADPNLTINGKFAPLHVACKHGKLNIVKILLKAGADPNIATDDDGITPLLFANHKLVIIQELIKAGADYNHISRLYFTLYNTIKNPKIQSYLKSKYKSKIDTRSSEEIKLGDSINRSLVKGKLPLDLINKIKQEYLFSHRKRSKRHIN